MLKFNFILKIKHVVIFYKYNTGNFHFILEIKCIVIVYKDKNYF